MDKDRSVDVVRYNMRRLRMEKHMTQHEFGELLGFSPDTAGRYISMIESGVRNPTFEMIDKLCEKFDLTRDYFFALPEPTLPAKAQFAASDGTVVQILSPRGKLSEETIRSLRDFADYLLSKEKDGTADNND